VEATTILLALSDFLFCRNVLTPLCCGGWSKSRQGCWSGKWCGVGVYMVHSAREEAFLFNKVSSDSQRHNCVFQTAMLPCWSQICAPKTIRFGAFYVVLGIMLLIQ